MAPTPLTATTRYTPPGVRKYYWLTTVATQASPTRIEMNAGIDLTAEVADIAGWTLDANQADAPDLSGPFTPQVAGRLNAADSSMAFWASSTSNDSRTVFPRNTVGFMLILPEGDVPTQKMEVWPAKVRSMYVDPAIEDPAKVNVQFSITKAPSQNVTIPS